MNGEITFGILCLLAVIWHEYSWWRKRDWRRSFGKITGAEERKRRGKNRNSISYHPVIEYEISTGVSQFSSKYGSSIKPKINSQTRITISPDEQKAEQYTLTNRWLFTIFPLILALVFISKGADLLSK